MSDIEVVSVTNVKGPIDQFTIAFAHCPAGKVAIGGGFDHPPSTVIQASQSMPIIHEESGLPTGWMAQARLNLPVYNGNWSLTAYAICADVG